MKSNRPYVQLDPAVIEQARQMDLLSYLQRYEPDNLKHVARNVYCTVRFMKVPGITTLFLSERMKAELLSMRPIVVRWPAPLREMHQEVTSGIPSAFRQESLVSRCIYLKQLLTYFPMLPCSNVKVRTIKKKICFLFRVCISQKKR